MLLAMRRKGQSDGIELWVDAIGDPMGWYNQTGGESLARNSEFVCPLLERTVRFRTSIWYFSRH